MKKIYVVLLATFFINPGISFASIDANLKYGSRGQGVTELQDFLIKKGFLTTQATGNFFSLTKKAVIAYQESLGLPNTGYVGTMTRSVINNELSRAKTTTVSAPKTISAITGTTTSTSTIHTNIPATTTPAQISTPTLTPISGCTSTSGYSSTTGLPCSGASQSLAPTTDVCKNLDGVQTLAPAGTYIDNGNCVSSSANTTTTPTLNTTQTPSAFTPVAPAPISW